MKAFTVVMCIQVFVCLGCGIGADATPAVALYLRIQPEQGGRFICEATNMTQQVVRFFRANNIFMNGNTFKIHALNDVGRYPFLMGGIDDFIEEPPTLDINPLAKHRIEIGLDSFYALLKNHKGQFISVSWRLNNLHSHIVCVALPDAQGNIAPPVVDPRDPTAKPILAFVFNENQTNELAFLFLNGSNETVTVEKPLTQASRIVATAPAIGYTNELFIAGQPSESITIEAGKVGEWRIPWQTIHGLIPEADLTAIKAAGGDLDLVWKVGEVESDPLPISLAEPEPN